MFLLTRLMKLLLLALFAYQISTNCREAGTIKESVLVLSSLGGLSHSIPCSFFKDEKKESWKMDLQELTWSLAIDFDGGIGGSPLCQILSMTQVLCHPFFSILNHP